MINANINCIKKGNKVTFFIILLFLFSFIFFCVLCWILLQQPCHVGRRRRWGLINFNKQKNIQSHRFIHDSPNFSYKGVY